MPTPRRADDLSDVIGTGALRGLVWSAGLLSRPLAIRLGVLIAKSYLWLVH